MESFRIGSVVLFRIVYLQLLKLSVEWRQFFSMVLSSVWLKSSISLKQNNIPVAKSAGILAFLLQLCS